MKEPKQNKLNYKLMPRFTSDCGMNSLCNYSAVSQPGSTKNLNQNSLHVNHEAETQTILNFLSVKMSFQTVKTHAESHGMCHKV